MTDMRQAEQERQRTVEPTPGPHPAVLRTGGWAAVAGGVLAIVVNLMAPRPEAASATDPTALADLAATAPSWPWIGFGVNVALLLLLVGFFAITRSVQGPITTLLARLGLGAALIGTITGTIAHAMNAGLHEGAGTLAPEVLDSTSFVSEGIGALWTLTYFGLGMLLYGAALVRDAGYPTLLGWTAVLGGVVGLAAGAIQSVAGPTEIGTFVLFPVTSVLATLVLLYAGVLLLRRASG